MSQATGRATDLLRTAADAMSKGSDPFHTSFLIEHEVTLDEVYDMSETIALIVRGYLRAPRTTRDTIVILGADTEGLLPPDVVEHTASRHDVMRRLSR